MALVTNVFRRGGSYYFRTRVPARFAKLLERKELWRSLRTRHARDARQRASVAVLLTEALWRDLERLMFSTPTPTRADIDALIARWLRSNLDEDAVLRRRTEQDREGEWLAGVILEPDPVGAGSVVVETLSRDELDELDKSSEAVRAARTGSPRKLIVDVNEIHVRRGLRHERYEDSAKRLAAGDLKLARQDVISLLDAAGLAVDPKSDAFDLAVRSMARAHADFAEASGKRDNISWRPGLDRDPVEEVVQNLDKRIASQPATPSLSSPQQSRRALLPFTVAANQALDALAKTYNYKPKRRADYQNAFDVFINWAGRDLILSEVTPEIAGDFQVALSEQPANANVRPEYRDLVSFAERTAKAKANGDEKTLGPVTINGKYLTPLRRVCEYHKKAGSGLSNPFDGISAQTPRKSDPKEQRRDFSIKELQRFFDLPAFTGAKALHGSNSARSGDILISDHRYWVPLICVFSGMRLNEACGLAMTDVKEEDGITYVHIRDDFRHQRIKSNAARRKVPIHRQLVDLGLIDQIASWKRQGYDRLFPELTVDKSGYYSHGPSKKFLAWIKRIADEDPDDPGKLVFHSMRHTVISRLRAAEVRQDVSHEIVGHEEGDVHAGYGKVDLPTLKAAIDKIIYPGINLSRLSRRSA